MHFMEDILNGMRMGENLTKSFILRVKNINGNLDGMQMEVIG